MANGTAGERRAEREHADVRLQLLLIVFFAAVSAIQAVVYYPRMPEVMATHFSLAGQPNGWSSSTTFVLTFSLFEALFVALGFSIPKLIEHVPSQWVNIPYRSLWLAEPHRARTLSDLRSWMLWLSVVTLAFLVATVQQIYNANLGGGEPVLAGSYKITIVAFVVALIWLVFTIYRRFGRRPSR